MESFLQVENLTKSVGDRVLFADVTFGVNEGDKIGIVAKNGTGKTTLLRCIAGLESPDSGRITFHGNLRLGLLEQTPALDPDLSVIDACLSSDTPTARIVAEYESALLSNDSALLEEALSKMESAGAWDFEDRLKRILTQLKIVDLNQRVSELSGGQRKRVALARIILEEPDFILLDEPTNHLDIETIEWLEKWLKQSRVTLLMVTHDRYFLDRICNQIIEIDRQQMFTYQGNYDYYLRKRSERIEAMTAELAKVKNTLRKEQEWMNRQPQARAGKAKYRIDAFYDLKERSRLNLEEKNVKLEVKSSYIGSKIFEAKNIFKKYGDKVILSDFSYTFARYEKLGIIGENGVGKSTFIKMLQGLVAQDSGEWNLGETVRFGYYNQDGIQLDKNKRVIDAVTEKCEDIVVNGSQHFSPMQFLQKFLFTPLDQQKYIHTLSGGELARLHLATVLMTSPNFLILDEPTNDLDIITLGLLEEYLSEFSGCLIVISHDRHFLDNIVDHLFVFEGDGKIKDFPGNYSEYREYIQTQNDAETSASLKNQVTERPKTERKERMSFKEKKEFEALSKEIEDLTAEKYSLESMFNSGKVITDMDEKSRRYNELKELLDEKEMRWLELSEKDQ
ncbi:MAG: ABC-F family ATP-binding cassette domain-containing protein [Bacteroidales bacterium]|nr:ABC-F family ATP-binding cassette domain-containing protein [Bacteroidales bacterium]